MPTVQELATRVQNLYNRITILESNISESYDKVIDRQVKGGGYTNEKELNDLKAEADAYDRKFEEEESKLQGLGGKTRKQTLQEFVLLFFFVAYGLFAVSLAVQAQITQGGNAALKILGAMFFAGLLITGILIRYA